jgi:hypothetical protein
MTVSFRAVAFAWTLLDVDEEVFKVLLPTSEPGSICGLMSERDMIAGKILNELR